MKDGISARNSISEGSNWRAEGGGGDDGGGEVGDCEVREQWVQKGGGGWAESNKQQTSW